MYLGPLYYYLLAPALFLSGLNPVGPAIANALIGTLTVLLTWFAGRAWFGKVAGFVSAFFLAISPVAIIYSRSSWNPNPAPLFALICAYSIYQVWQNQKPKWIVVTAISLAAALQMHYLCLLLIPFLGLFWFLSLRSQNKLQKSALLRSSALGFLIFLLIMSPLVLFDLKHEGMNFKAFKSFFTDRQTTINLNPAKSDRFLPVLETINTDLYLARQDLDSVWPLIIFICLVFFALVANKNKSATYLTVIWIAIAVLGLGVYKQHVYIHYLGFIYPAVFLLLGLIISLGVTHKSAIVKFLSLSLFVYLTFLNAKFSPLWQQPNRQMQITENAVDLIIKESDGKPFNFGLIAKQNYDESYRYFFENKKAKMIRGEAGVTDQLFVICEDGDKCQPEGNPAYQIAIFGPAKVIKTWQINHLKIYLLKKTP
ncbi:hypothetical protein A2572_01595 [Candidatus Collierbacteria bacterium RIFOXYD1_FULL_40_9]|uniref:Glycosyltransferase RgtA/B/C/D-like domain-containing protein n=1 Tax=Candidatus Collierbacteria bacterium RIFOXYD1_FULL_40_9 TaxID=1817731 RepID=A0A1F5FUX6_9BACT|nr:MAG: hypothetical protein A2572_01595 [Candidatus Collierbacteria bacterium RIFOXYD1_FULL_40_9]